MNKAEHDLTFGHGRERLDKVFDLVRDPHDWKMPIDKVVHLSHPDIDGDTNVIRDAVVFFTGTVPTITPIRDALVRVKAVGYRNGPCGG